jgi:hypothetical protein
MNDAAIIAGLVRQVDGECCVCHCHGESCKMPDGDRCWWVGRLRTLCSAPACQAAYAVRMKQEAKRKRSSGKRGRAA